MSAVLGKPVVSRILAGDMFQEVRFGLLWHLLFFLLSGDKNKELHGIFGTSQRIVQGVAIVTKLGTFVSKAYPAFMVRRIGEITFKLPVHAGTSVNMFLEDFKFIKGNAIAEVTAIIRQGDQQIVKPVKLLLVKKE